MTISNSKMVKAFGLCRHTALLVSLNKLSTKSSPESAEVDRIPPGGGSLQVCRAIETWRSSMNQRLKNSLLLGVLGSLALLLGGQVHQDPCTKKALPGEWNKYFGPTCSGVTCSTGSSWFRRTQNDMCAPGGSLKSCSTMKDPLGPFTYDVYEGGACGGGECMPNGATWINTLSYDLWIFSSTEGCDSVE